MKKYLQSFLITVALAIGFGLVTPVPNVAAQSTTGTYSCGTYGAGQYSQGECVDSNVTPPNTGFARLMQPDYLLPIVGFLVVAIIGTAIIFKTRKQK